MKNWRSAAALACLWLLTGVAASEAGDEVTLMRVFMRDGSSLTSYGEFARVDDRVVFSIPTSPGPTPALQLVNIAADRVDWTRTNRYADAARSARYSATQGEDDYVQPRAQRGDVCAGRAEAAGDRGERSKDAR